MRIAIITNSLSRAAGGVSHSIRGLAQNLAKRDQTVCVFGARDPFTAADIDSWRPVSTVVFDTKGLGPFRYTPELAREVARFRPDVLEVHGLWSHASVVGAGLTRKLGCPLVIHPHGMLDSWALKNSRWKKALAAVLFERRHLKSAACLRALNQAEAEAFRAFGITQPIAVVPNGMDLPMLSGVEDSGGFPQHKSSAGPRRKSLLYLGRIHPKKGLVNLLDGWRALRQQSGTLADQWTLTIAGWDEGGHELELQQHCAKLGIKWADARNGVSSEEFPGQVTFVGPRFNEEKEKCYRNCDAFILPSLSEGLPMVVLEAWSHGKPVVMTPQCNLPEGFSAGAAIRIESNSESISHGLESLFAIAQNSPEAGLSAMGQKGRELVASRFTWARVAAEMESVYGWLAAGKPKPSCVL